MNLELVGKRALVTGSSSGIGEATFHGPAAAYTHGANLRIDGGLVP